MLPIGCVLWLPLVAVLAGPVQHHELRWPGRAGLRLHYTRSAPQSPAVGASEDAQMPIVFLPGFGVGAFHFEAQLEQLGKERPAYALDWLGQGESWPDDEHAERGLRYDADLWRDQLEVFLDEVLGGRPAILCGNSLGGFIGVQLALKRPDLVRALALLNATPLWSFAAPIGEQDAWRPFGWDATLPAPRLASAIGSRWFDTLRNPRTIEKMLATVYSDARAVRAVSNIEGSASERSLPDAIAAAASKRGGHEAFTSILFSPRTAVSFERALVALGARPKAPAVLLLYGRDDPWVSPLFAERVHRRVASLDVDANGPTREQAREDVAHYVIEGVGHCPHHEAPVIVNRLLCLWCDALDAAGEEGLAANAMPAELSSTESFSRSLRALRRNGEPLGPLEAVAGAVDRLLLRLDRAGPRPNAN